MDREMDHLLKIGSKMDQLKIGSSFIKAGGEYEKYYSK
jgi:hypothetical protein